jgi:hypothetical protein
MRIKKQWLFSTAAIAAVLAAGCTERSASQPQAPAAPASSEAPPVQPAPETRVAPIAITDARIAEDSPRVTSCNLETVNGTLSEGSSVSVKRGAPVVVVGWLVDEVSKSVPASAKWRLQSADGVSAWEQSIPVWGDRPDVAASKGDAYLKSGFTIEANLSELPAGDYAMYLAFQDGSGEQACAVGRQLNLID